MNGLQIYDGSIMYIDLAPNVSPRLNGQLQSKFIQY